MEGLKVRQLDKLGGIRKFRLTAGPLSYSNAFFFFFLLGNP